jgi:hypothetical protein
MTNPDSRAPLPPSARAHFERGLSWIHAGWQLVRADPPLWLGMSAIYLLLATLFGNIPFAGFLLVVMVSPMLLASVLLTLDTASSDADGHSDRATVWIKRPARQLLRVFGNESHVFAIVLLGIVTLGLVVMLRIAEYLLGVGSFAGIMSVIIHRLIPPWWLLISLLLAAILNIALIMGLMYVTHRTVLAGRDPLIGLRDSFTACVEHAGAMTALIGIFVALGLLLMSAFYLSAIVGYLLLYTLGLVALPVLVCASYRSYRDIFPA